MPTPVERRFAPATDWAAALIDTCIAAGLDHVVISPGSRSQALALVAADAARRGRVTVHVRIDERVAGFLALGLARESGKPAAVVVTSGTAVANLMPAVLEAHHSGIPMLLLTADRPPELRGVGANQTTTQPGFFEGFVRWQVDAPVPGPDTDLDHIRGLVRSAWDAATGATAGPVHLNVPLREPLAGDLPDWWTTSDPRARRRVPPAVPEPGSGEAWGEARTIAVAGADAGPAAAELAAAFGWPLIAEIVSGARIDDTAVGAYRQRLGDPDLAARIERVVVFGHPTLTREVTALLRRDDIDIRAVGGAGEALDLNGATRSVSLTEVRVCGTPADTRWRAEWSPGGEPRSEAPSDADADPRTSLLRAVWDATTARDRVFFASSRLVRIADAVLPPRRVRVHANRGLAGIDGTLATALGIALAQPEGVTRVVVGDLAFLHDVGALLLPPDEPRPSIQIVVGNDGGGTIFGGLEVATIAHAADFARVQYTPQSVDLAALAAAYGWAHIRADGAPELTSALAVQGPIIIERRLPVG